jgi:hypothetical protein
MWFPNWLLALLVVVFMALSNVELLISFIKLRRLRRESAAVTLELHRLIDLQRQLSRSGLEASQAAPAALAKQASAAQLVVDMDSKYSATELASSAAQLQLQVEHLIHEAQHIEGMALLYPAYHVASVEDSIRLSGFTKEELEIGKELALAAKQQEQEQQQQLPNKGQVLPEGAAAAAVPVSADSIPVSNKLGDEGLQELLEYYQ